MQSSSPLLFPQTPSGSRNPLPYKPLNSSPLADSPNKSSPLSAAQARRKSQYKSPVPIPPRPLFSRPCASSSRRAFSYPLCALGSGLGLGSGEGGDPQKAFLRDRLKARCIERAVRAREKAVRVKRSWSLSEPSSDDFPMDGEDEEEDDDDIMQDELFRRIVADATRRRTRDYRISFAQEVGSSFDPDLEDISTWEQELTAPSPADNNQMTRASTSGTAINAMQASEPNMLTPVDLDDEELEEYAEEYARRAALADFEDIPDDELFAWSEGEELDGSPTRVSNLGVQRSDYEDGMDVS